MKLTRTKIILLAAFALANGFSASAQSNGVPGDADYAKFSQFITDRNIFDPNREPRTSRPRTTYTPRTRTRTRTSGAPEFTLVGTMSYEKGLFAFFDGNNSDLKAIVTADGEIATYKVKSITASTVTLVGPDKKEFSMKVGEQMRQEGGAWQLNGQAESTAPAAESGSSSGSGTADAAPIAPSPSLEANDVLKRLMEKRAKENQ